MNKKAKVMKILISLMVSICILFVADIKTYADDSSNYTWNISYFDSSTKDGKVSLTLRLKLTNKTGTAEPITVTEGNNKFYIDNILVDDYEWTYSGLGGTAENPEIIYEREISYDYAYVGNPTISVNTHTNYSTYDYVKFAFTAASKKVELKNVITAVPTYAFTNNPWTWTPSITFYDRIIGYSYETNTNSENYDISEMKKTLSQWTSGTVGFHFYPSDAEKYFHITFYTYGGTSISYVYQIPSVSTLSYNTDGGTSINSNAAIFTGGQTTVTSSAPTKTEYTFNGWYTGVNGTGTKYNAGDAITLSSDTTLYAYWTANESTLTVDPNGGTWVGSSNSLNINGSYNETIQIPIPTREGYTFTGWTRLNTYGILSSLTENATYIFGETANVTDTIKANWELTNYIIETKYTGSGVISNDTKVVNKQDTSVFIIPADGYTTTSLKIDGVSVTPTENYNFLDVTKDHKVEVAFTMTQTRKMSVLASTYDWIDLKLN